MSNGSVVVVTPPSCWDDLSRVQGTKGIGAGDGAGPGAEESNSTTTPKEYLKSGRDPGDGQKRGGSLSGLKVFCV